MKIFYVLYTFEINNIIITKQFWGMVEHIELHYAGGNKLKAESNWSAVLKLLQKSKSSL